MHNINDINLVVAQILGEGKELSEKIIEANNPSIEFNQYFSDVSDIVYKLQDLYYKSSGNRNAMLKEGTAMIKSIVDRSHLALNRLEISPPEDVNEADGIIEPEEDPLKNPRLINQPLTRNSFVQAGEKRLSLVNEKFLIKNNKVYLNLRTTMLATIENVSQGIRIIFFVEGTYYYADSLSNAMLLKPFERQATAGSVAGDLNNPARLEAGKRRVNQLI